MTILHSQCLPTELVKTANAVAINSVSGPVTGVVAPTSAPATGASVWYIDTSTSPDTLYFWNGTVWSVVGDSSSLATQDEGVALGATSTMNFVGTGVTATYAAGVATVTIPSGTISTQDEGVALGSTSTVNFAGGGVTATYAAGVTTVTVPSATSLAFQDETVALGSTSTVNFAGAGVVATNAAGVTTVTIPGGSGTFATNAEAQAGTSTALLVNPANLYARENITAQTGVANDPAAVPAPTAGQSNWATNLQGERLHYMPGIGWQVVANAFGLSTRSTVATFGIGAGTVVSTWNTWTATRPGRVHAVGYTAGANPGFSVLVGIQSSIYLNGTRQASAFSSQSNITSGCDATSSVILTVAAGDILTFRISAQNITQFVESHAMLNYI
jgi:hypothetical protein